VNSHLFHRILQSLYGLPLTLLALDPPYPSFPCTHSLLSSKPHLCLVTTRSVQRPSSVSWKRDSRQTERPPRNGTLECARSPFSSFLLLLTRR
jgi:hypothetical protein